MSKNLVIVESPAKAATIQKFLGPDFRVEASFGHIRDLPKSGLGIDIEHNFEPKYEISPDKAKRVGELRRLAKGAEVWLASDEDREGEAIAWHLCGALGLDPKTTKRIVFHEITETAIKNAAAHPRTVDQHLVDAQQARRVLDRLVGYELSPVLWKKIQPGLSAGRVQSVAVRLIAEREREIEKFEAGSAFRVTADFAPAVVNGSAFNAELPTKLPDAAAAREFLDACAAADFTVSAVATTPATRTPAAPFTTSTLQQEAARKLGFSVKQTMVVAQKLYEAGHITYMRTDSVHLSDTALTAAASAIRDQFGANYYQRRQYTTKSAGAQEAHEAIRPTHFGTLEAGADHNAHRLYRLIWKRAVASQMADAKLERTTADIAISTRSEKFQAKGEIIIFDGFLKLYLAKDASDDENGTAGADGILPVLTVGEKLTRVSTKAVQTYDRPKPRYNEAGLVKKLEEMGIGRPSTYVPTISTIQDRGYVVKGDLTGNERPVKTLILDTAGQLTETDATEIAGADKNKLIPTSTGMVVNDFLVQHFPDVIDYNFTSEVEDEFDKIEDGQETWNRMIADFYGPFHQTVLAADALSREQVSHARHLGLDPKSGKPVLARIGRFGPMLQIGEAKNPDGSEAEEKPRFAPMPAGRRIDDVTLDEALEMFKLPRDVGQTDDGLTIQANIGRFGPYVMWGKGKKLYASIKPDDPFTITHERALELVKAKLAADAAKHISTFEKSGLQILNGRWGAYVTDGKKNAKVPKDRDPKTVTEAEAKELIAKAPVRAKRKRVNLPKI